MEIYVDADACPVKKIIVKVAREKNLKVIMIVDTSHQINDGYSKVIVVDKGCESVDIALINHVSKDDIVVTQDFGVAVMALGKKAKALNQNGLIYTDDNIDRLLLERHVGSRIRRGGGKTKREKKRAKLDDENFEKSFRSLL